MPNLHPLLVHFPVALLCFSFLAELAALLTRDARFSFVGWWSQLVGSVGIAAAVVSGLLARKSVTVGVDAYDLLATHQEAAFITSTLFGVLLLWRIGTRTILPPRLRWLYLLLFAAGIAFVLRTAWSGGALIYRLGTAAG